MIDAPSQCAVTVWHKSEVAPSCHGIQLLSMDYLFIHLRPPQHTHSLTNTRAHTHTHSTQNHAPSRHNDYCLLLHSKVTSNEFLNANLTPEVFL